MFANKQSHALERQEKMAYPSGQGTQGQRLGLPRPFQRNPAFAGNQQNGQTPSADDGTPLTNSIRPVEEGKPSREASSKSQSKVDVEKAYVEWSTFDEPDGMDATALYNERGEALKRYSGEEP